MITLKHVYLDGWLSYDKFDLSLDFDGITYINGNIGSGKSAILEAIFYLLFGKTLRGKDSVNSLINKVLNNGYEIKLDFDIDGKSYSIKEIRDREGKGLYFWPEGKKEKELCGKTDPETRKNILNTLKMDATTFSSIAFLGQRQTQLLVEGTPAERAGALVDIFGLNKYDELIDACEDEIKQVLDSKELLSSKYNQYEQDLTSLETSLQVAALEPVDIADIAKIDSSIATIEAKLAKIREKSNQINKAIGEANALQQQQKRCKEIEATINSLEEELKNKKEPTVESEVLEQEVINLRVEKNKADDTVKRIKQEIEKIEKLGNKCPINSEDCPVNIPTTYKENRICSCTKEKDECQNKINKLDKVIAKSREELSTIEEYEDLKDKLDGNVSNLEKFQTVGEIPDVTQEKDKLVRCQEAVVEGTTKLNEQREKRNSLITAQARIQQQEEMQKRVQETLKEKRKELKVFQKDIEKYSIEGQYLAAALSVFKKAKIYRIDLVLQVLNESMQEILASISDGELKARFESQKKDSKGKKTLDKVIILVADSYKEIPIELCSGGQSALVGISCLLSVWKAANKISDKCVSCLFLDEVFGSLHEDLVDRVFNAIIETSKSLGTQSVYLISHQALDAKLIDRTVKVVLEDGITNSSII